MEAKMLARIGCILGTAFIPGVALSQDWEQIAYYVAYVGPEDMRTSSGKLLQNLGGILQQDRANYHQFGIRHPQDGDDPIFDDRNLRAMIPDMVSAGGNSGGGLSQDAQLGQPFLVNVFVCGSGSNPSVIYLAGPGEDHSGCF